jgi:hypothetical protein
MERKYQKQSNTLKNEDLLADLSSSNKNSPKPSSFQHELTDLSKELNNFQIVNSNGEPINIFVDNGKTPYPLFIEELEEETLLDITHNENVEKLNCILVLSGYLVDLAKSRFNPFLNNSANNQPGSNINTPIGNNTGIITNNPINNQNPSTNLINNPTNVSGNIPNMTSNKAYSKSFDQFTVADVSFKRAEQLVLYLKCLQLLKPVLSFARDEIKNNNLKSTFKVRKIIKQLNNMYKFCLYQCKQLYNSESIRNKLNLDKINLNADRLLYIHAIELCRESAMEEFFGKPQKVYFIFVDLLDNLYLFM